MLFRTPCCCFSLQLRLLPPSLPLPCPSSLPSFLLSLPLTPSISPLLSLLGVSVSPLRYLFAFPHVLKSSACLFLGCGLLNVVKLCSELRPSALQTQLKPGLWMQHYDDPKKLFCLPGGGCVCVCVRAHVHACVFAQKLAGGPTWLFHYFGSTDGPSSYLNLPLSCHQYFRYGSGFLGLTDLRCCHLHDLEFF